MSVFERPCYIDVPKIGKYTTGILCPLEYKSLPFEPKHAFFVYAGEANTRGGHAHRGCEQLIFNMGPSSLYVQCHTGEEQSTYDISENRALYVPPMNWVEYGKHITDFLFCFMSQPYDESDYIRDWDKYQEMCKVMNNGL